MRAAEPLAQVDTVVMGQPSSLQSDYRSNYGSMPGDEFPAAVYGTVVLAFVWMMLAAWLAFGGTRGTDLDLAVATVLCTAFLGIPIILSWTARNRLQGTYQNSKQFLESRVRIATGTVSGTEAWLQVALIPIALAFAATLIGGAFALTS